MLWIGTITFTIAAIATWNHACARHWPLSLTAVGVGIFTIASTLASVRGGSDRRQVAMILLGIGAGVALFFIFFYHWVDSCTA